MTPSQEAVERIKLICTYHSDDGTSGYLLSDKQFKAISQELQKAEDREQERIRKTFFNKIANGEFFNPWLIDEYLPNTVLKKLLKVIIKKLDESLKKGTK